MLEDDLSDETRACLALGIDLLEERAQCIAGCGCREDVGWDDPDALRELARLRPPEWRAEMVSALERLGALDDAEAASASRWLGSMVHATGPSRTEDARTFFSAALAALR